MSAGRQGPPVTALLATALLAGVQVLVLGSHHFANPGLDLHNARVDDVLAPRRQHELAQLVERLARFRPTLVAVESRSDVPALPARAPPSRNEIEQIGLRLVRRLQLPAAAGIDAPGEFPFQALQEYATKTGRAAELQQAVDALGERTRAFEATAAQSSIAAQLRQLNSPEAIRSDHGWYLQALAYGDGNEQPGAELLGRWMARNAALCARLAQRVGPGDRVLVLLGAGHNHLLRQCVLDMPGWTLIDALSYLSEGP